jgi:hypothetical protein
LIRPFLFTFVGNGAAAGSHVRRASVFIAELGKRGESGGVFEAFPLHRESESLDIGHFSLRRIDFWFYFWIAILSIVLDYSLKPLDPILKHRNEHLSVDFAEYLVDRTFSTVPVRKVDSLQLLFQKTEEKEIT